MSILTELGKLLSPNDPELVQKTVDRINEQDKWNDVFSTKLIELLDKIDQIKSESRERLRKADERIQRAESVTQAESSLFEKAAKLNDALQLLELASAAERRASALAEEAKNRWEHSSIRLEEARQTAEAARILAQDASGRFRCAQDSLDQATKLSSNTVRYATLAVTLSWIASVWAGWFIIQTKPSFWAATTLSILLVSVAALLIRGRQE
jgi:hypothetical protein